MIHVLYCKFIIDDILSFVDKYIIEVKSKNALIIRKISNNIIEWAYWLYPMFSFILKIFVIKVYGADLTINLTYRHEPLFQLEVTKWEIFLELGYNKDTQSIVLFVKSNDNFNFLLSNCHKLHFYMKQFILEVI